MAVRRRIHLRLCAGALLLTLPIAATSTNAVSARTVASGIASEGSEASSVAGHPFAGFVATAASQSTTVDTGAVARRVKAAGDQRLEGASPTPPDALVDVDLDELDIPRAALVAYQVAATTMRQADAECGIDWTVLAAIGRVETDHGRHAGSRLGADGISKPLIRGVALTGKGPVAQIRDTDGGRLDGDKKWDRAVGPMQFLPSTWGYAGVDADGDGVRSPDNINDAALGAAVYLCAAPGRLDRPAGLRAAVLRYNPSDAYVDLVVRLAKAYGKGELAEIPTGGTTLALGAIQTGSSAGSSTTTPSSSGPGRDDRTAGNGGRGDNGGGTSNEGNGNGNDRDGSTEGTGRGQVKEPGRGGSDIDSDEPRPDFGPDKDPKPPKDPEPEPVLVTLTGVLTYLEDQTGADGIVSDQWVLTNASVDDVLVEDVLLDVGDETWLAEPSVADLDGNEILESNLVELTGLLDDESVVVQVEEGTEPALVHTVNESAYLPAE